MKVTFAKSFFESLKRLRRHQTWWYRTYELFRYNLPAFFRNVRRFRKELWRFRTWDSVYNLRLFRRSLELTVETIRHGYEVDETRLKKVAAMERAIELMKKFEKDNFIEEAEAELGKLHMSGWGFEKLEAGKPINDEETPAEAAHNSAVFKRTHELEDSYWQELWKIIAGKPWAQQEKEWEEAKKRVKEDDHEQIYHEANKTFDGSGMRSWWD